MGGRIAFLLALAFCCSCSAGEAIPLDRIWALNMPGTKSVRELEPEHYGKNVRSLPEEEQIEHLQQSLSFQIQQTIKRQTENRPIGPGFVVTGTGKDALHNVMESLESASRSQTVPADEEIAVFFYSREFGSYVHLERVSMVENTLTLSYRFVKHSTKTTEANFALIPLGKLPVGQYRVEIAQLPVEREIRADLSDIVCKPFQFSVSKEGEK
jgi:hypothetical protein